MSNKWVKSSIFPYFIANTGWHLSIAKLISLPSKLGKLVTIKKMKTFSAKAEDIDREWYVIDAADQILGQVAEKQRVFCAVKVNQFLHHTWTPVILSLS